MTVAVHCVPDRHELYATAAGTTSFHSCKILLPLQWHRDFELQPAALSESVRFEALKLPVRCFKARTSVKVKVSG